MDITSGMGSGISKKRADFLAKEHKTDRQKVNEWLDSIGEFDKLQRDEVLGNCATDPEARDYFVKRWENECKPG